MHAAIVVIENNISTQGTALAKEIIQMIISKWHHDKSHEMFPLEGFENEGEWLGTMFVTQMFDE